jgi:hypothetical protein
MPFALRPRAERASGVPALRYRKSLGGSFTDFLNLRRICADTVCANTLSWVRLIGRNSGGELPMSSGWRVTYCGRIVDYRDEHDAKSLARELIKRGFRVSAETDEGAFAARRIEPTQIRAWLSD